MNRHQYAELPSCLDLGDAADMRRESELALARARMLGRSRRAITAASAAFLAVAVVLCAAGSWTAMPCAVASVTLLAVAAAVHACESRILRERAETLSILEHGLDAVDWRDIMGCEHPWKTF